MENGNKPAYPISEEESDRIDAGVNIYLGLTKREYFAGLAMKGLLAKEGVWSSDEILAKRSVEIADELLKQLEQ